MTRKFLVLSSCAAALTAGFATQGCASDWPMFGVAVDNLAYNASERDLSKDTVQGLAPKWIAAVGGNVSARAAVVDGTAYFPDWAGNLWALDTTTGKPVWQHSLQGYGFPAGTISRTTPAVSGGSLYFGTQKGAYLVAVDRRTGALKWLSQIDSHPLAVLSSSPAVKDGVIYGGVASVEETTALHTSYPCCSFRGSVYAVDEASGHVVWKTFTVPSGYNGGSVWGSNLVVDRDRKEIFAGTGNNYTDPTAPAYTACVAAGGTRKSCLSPDDHFDSLVALDLTTGAVRWHRRLASSDDWNASCFFGSPGVGNCPAGSGPDYDFGSAPQEFTIKLSNGGTKTIIGAGQKSGVYSAFDADTHQMVWARQVGPGSVLGGIQWGSAYDGHRIYVAISNLDGKHYAGGQAGSWTALDPATGAVLWRTPDPNSALDLGPLAVANGVVYAPSMAGAPNQANMYALNAATGDILWSYASGASVIAGASIVDGSVYWGSGYTNLGLPGQTGNTKFFAFGLGGANSGSVAKSK